jgi:hypothetical protein
MNVETSKKIRRLVYHTKTTQKKSCSSTNKKHTKHQHTSNLLRGFAEFVHHEGAEHGGLEQRAQGGSHAAQHQQTLVVVLVEPSGVQHIGQVGR